MSPFGFCGGTYQSESLNVDAQRCMNLYPENNAPESASPVALYRTPGLLEFCDLGTGPVGGLFGYQPSGAPFARYFAVASNLTEIFSNGTFTNYAFVPTSLPVTMAANNANQLIVCTGGALYLFDMVTNTASQVATNLGKSFQSVGFLNGYFLALQQNSQTVWYSAIEDGTSWDALDFFAVNWYADNIVSMFIDHGQIWLHGSKQTVVYYNSLDPLLPFLPIQSALIEQGCAAEFSVTKVDNSICWISADERGQGIARRANGYNPQRISTHAIEQAWAKYSAISDAIGYTYQENGHEFWVLYFPTANKTWVFDAATGLWHERSYWTGSVEQAHRSRCHVLAFGKHLVGDTQSGKIWDMSIDYLDDFGHPIRRYRRAPHIVKKDERDRIFHKRMQVVLESGTGPSFQTGGDLQGPTFICLEDSDNILWNVSIRADYLLQSSLTPSGTPQTIVIQDSANPSDYWVLGVNTYGMLTTTAHDDSESVGTAYPMIAQDNTQAQITVSGGLLQTGPGANAPTFRGPYVWLRWSDDGGHVWKSEQFRDTGTLGEYRKRVIWRRLGNSRDRVYEFGTAEPFALSIVDANLWADSA